MTDASSPTNPVPPGHGELYAALSKAQGEFPAIPKSKTAKVVGKNKMGERIEFTYKYADIGDVLSATRPVCAKHGLAVIQRTEYGQRGPILVTKLGHSSGQSETSVIELGNYDTPQAMGSLLTYLRRYQLCAILGVAAEEDDDGGADQGERDAKPKQRQQQSPPQNASKPTGARFEKTPPADRSAPPPASSPSQGTPQGQSPAGGGGAPATAAAKEGPGLAALAKQKHWSPEQVTEFIGLKFGKPSSRELTPEQKNALTSALLANTEPAGAVPLPLAIARDEAAYEAALAARPASPS